MENFKILIAEDDTWYAEVLSYHLSLNPDNSVSHIDNGKEVLKSLKNNPPHVITLDYDLGDCMASEILPKIKESYPEIEILIISGQEEVKTAVELLKKGAFDYIVKDEDVKDRVWKSIENIKQKFELKAEIKVLKEEVKSNYDFGKQIIGNSSYIKSLFPILQKAANSSINVSITGETGTGKEVVAKSIHFNSPRNSKPFVAVNVSAIPSELIESELFGHEKGAFTGASSRRIGKFEEAKDGTIFLDEMGEMDLGMQSKLLRVIQERELTRVGGSGSVKINCRIICATHKDLQAEVSQGNFRQDLFYRVIGLPIKLPSLRQRKEDIPLLVNHFIKVYSKENKTEIKKINDGGLNKLLKHNYKGNVRELKAIVDLAMVLTDGKEIGAESIQFYSEDPTNDLNFEELTLREYNHKILNHYLKKYNNNVLQVAKTLDIGKSTIYRMLKE